MACPNHLEPSLSGGNQPVRAVVYLNGFASFSLCSAMNSSIAATRSFRES